MLIVGDKEVESGAVTPRFRDGRNLDPVTAADFIRFITQEAERFH
jgi:threonyl-tRNA synthetase